MSLKKSTYIEDYRLIHTWTDDDIDFKAEVHKEDYSWVATVGRNTCIVWPYRSAVDFVMDEWRLAKSGFATWEEAAREMCEGDWDLLPDDEQQDLIEASKRAAR